MATSTECHNCGAPASAGLVACAFCKAEFPDAGDGVACPRCENVNREQNAQCAVCHAPLSRGCLFCGASSTLASSACQHCGEAFAGDVERKRARDAEVQQQQTMQLLQQGVQVFGAVAASSAGNDLFGALESMIEDATKK